MELTNDQFFELLSQRDEFPKTSQITPYQFVDIYLEQAKLGVEHLILVLINSKGSSTYENSRFAIEMFFEEYPEYNGKMTITSIDGMGYSALYGQPVIKAIEMRDNGATAQEIVEYLTNILPQREVLFGIYELKYAAKSGRIPSVAALVGKLINLKPIMQIYQRDMKNIAKCIGEKNLIRKIVDLTKQEMQPNSPYEVIYAVDRTDIKEFEQMLTEELGYGPSAVYQTGAAVGANAGPKLAGISFIKRK